MLPAPGPDQIALRRLRRIACERMPDARHSASSSLCVSDQSDRLPARMCASRRIAAVLSCASAAPCRIPFPPQASLPPVRRGCTTTGGDEPV